MGRGGRGGLCEIFLTELNPGYIYVAGKYELAKGVGYKVGRGQKLSNCESHFFWGRGGRGVLYEFF